jgi:hypothetical protein
MNALPKILSADEAIADGGVVSPAPIRVRNAVNEAAPIASLTL